MNCSIFTRIVWKEYRTQRAFWISMLVLTVLGQLLALVRADVGPERLNWLFGLALALPAFYALGCGAVLFAVEHEVGTYESQRALPLSIRQLLAGKLTFAAVSLVLLVGVTWLTASAMAGGLAPRNVNYGGLWGLWGVAALELLAWGVFFSLVSTRPLTAAILGVVAASIMVHLLAASVVQSQLSRYWELSTYVQALPQRIGVVLLVAAADVWLGLRWFRVRAESPDSDQPTAENVLWFWKKRPSLSQAADAMFPARIGIAQLLWQHWRQSRRLMLGVWGGFLLVGLLFFRALEMPAQLNKDAFGLLWFLAVVSAALMGACVFVPDQRGSSFRFFAEQGVRPRYVWLSRQLVWAAPVVAVTLLIGVLMLCVFPTTREAYRLVQPSAEALDKFALAGITIVDISHVGRFLWCLVLAFAAAQFCSIFFRSSILAGVFGLVLSGLILAWAGLMFVAGVPWWWSVVPLPFLLLLATWLRAPDWILERNTPRAWLKLAGALVVPAILLLVAVAVFRVRQVPLVDPGFSPEEYARAATPEEAKTMQLYQRAWDLYVGAGSTADRGSKEEKGEGGWTRAERETLTNPRPVVAPEAIAVMLEASQRPEADFFSPTGDGRIVGKVERLAGHVLVGGELLETQGKHPEALERYLATLRISQHLRHRSRASGSADYLEAQVYRHLLDWAAAKEVTAKQIAEAISRLQTQLQQTPSPGDEIKSEYVAWRAVAAGNPEAIAGMFPDKEQPLALFRISLMNAVFPWESRRTVRVLNQVTAERMAELRQVETLLDKAQPVDVLPTPELGPTWERWETTTPFLWLFRGWGNRVSLAFLTMETQRRAVLILLAIQAWKTEHGELPPRLESLVGPYLECLPLDPCSGEPFRYLRDGVPVSLQIRQRWAQSLFLTAKADQDGNILVPANSPFLWSASPWIRVRLGGDDFRETFGIREWPQLDRPRKPSSVIDLWQNGWVFPVP